MDHSRSQLPRGQQQRVAVARALVGLPSWLDMNRLQHTPELSRAPTRIYPIHLIARTYDFT
jgi:predicted ABC-type transport system involved in lysophospholipase L1 biosynthesis ATPase subunit